MRGPSRPLALLTLAATLAAASCGPSARELRRERALADIRAALARGDAGAAVARYQRLRARRRGGEEPQALRMMAVSAVAGGLRDRSGRICARAIGLVERFDLDRLTGDVSRLVTAGAPVAAASAAIALYRVHPLAPAVATRLLRSEVAEARAIAAAGIAREVGRPARLDLLPLLDDPSPAVRRAVVGALAGFRDPRDRGRLTEMARDDPDPGVRARALRALARRAGEVPIDLVREAFFDPHPGVRLAALEILGTRGDAASGSLLLQAAASDDLPLAFRALVAARRAGLDVPATALERGLADRHWTVRAAALNALVESVPRPRALRLARAALDDPRLEVRIDAARVLRRLGRAKRARAELRAALSAARGMPRLSAATALMRLGDPSGLKTVEALARRGEGAVRAGALRAHRLVRRVTPALVEALADRSPQVRLLAAEVVLGILRAQRAAAHR